MALLDLLGRRMALRLLWELRDERRLTFRVLAAAVEAQPSVLNTRLKELRAVGLVDRAEAGYGLTARGAELLRLLLPIGAWADAWGADLTPQSERS